MKKRKKWAIRTLEVVAMLGSGAGFLLAVGAAGGCDRGLMSIGMATICCVLGFAVWIAGLIVAMYLSQFED